jgi:hypothetical protein
MTTQPGNAWGLRCPQCGADDKIDVAATVWIRLCPDGIDVTAAANGDHEWDGSHLEVCDACGHSATVRAFEPPD